MTLSPSPSLFYLSFIYSFIYHTHTYSARSSLCLSFLPPISRVFTSPVSPLNQHAYLSLSALISTIPLLSSCSLAFILAQLNLLLASCTSLLFLLYLLLASWLVPLFPSSGYQYIVFWSPYEWRLSVLSGIQSKLSAYIVY